MAQQYMQNNTNYSTKDLTCAGCKNHCQVQQFIFDNGRTYYSGNNCERTYTNRPEGHKKGVNIFAEKQKMLFETPPVSEVSMRLTIGIPRALGIYENYPFWRTLFHAVGIRVVISPTSTNSLYERGIRTIMADNICFPAKLMHGHIQWLADRKVDRIFYPWVVYEKKEDKAAKNSYNCPVVSGYSDVIRAAINPEKQYGIPLDSPVISFREEPLLRASIREYLTLLGIARKDIDHAITLALKAQQDYLDKLEQRNLEVLHTAQKEGRPCLLLAARPYHTDTLIQHKLAETIAEMGYDVLTENVATHAGNSVYQHLNACSQWTYPNRIFKAAEMVGHTPNLQMLQLTSFGCGPDAFILDEVRSILAHYHKNLTVLKIDDVNNTGSLILRVRSLIESVEAEDWKHTYTNSAHTDSFETSRFSTRTFSKEDRERTILVPFFAEGFNDFLPTLFRMAGYRLEMLPMGCREDTEEGLRDANNDICYPATIVVGSILRALRSGRYDLAQTAVGITQTGGQCRASNYYSLIKNALVSAGFAEVPVISLGLQPGIKNNQPGFHIPWLRIMRPLVEAFYFADALNKLYYPALPREKEAGIANRLYQHYLETAQPLLEARDYRGMRQLMREAAHVFSTNVLEKELPMVGLVGEIYVKYNAFSNSSIVRWLSERGVEVIPPALTGFFSTSIPNAHYNRYYHIRTETTPLGLIRLAHAELQRLAHTYDQLCSEYPYYRPFEDIETIARLSEQVIHPAADFGEGWFLPGEICHLAESGVQKIVSVQPFGCIANHIISKGIERRFHQLYPQLSILYLDFDSDTSEANIHNRLHFLLQ